MVKSHEFAVLLPENFLYKLVFFLVPGGEVVLYKSACISRICVKAPECVIYPLFLDKLPQICHPFQIGLAHISAPLTYKQRSCVCVIDVQPVVLPCVLFE